MTTAELPPIDMSARGDQLPSAARHTLVIGVLGAHLVAGWALMQIDAVRAGVAPSALRAVPPWGNDRFGTAVCGHGWSYFVRISLPSDVTRSR